MRRLPGRTPNPAGQMQAGTVAASLAVRAGSSLEDSSIHAAYCMQLIVPKNPRVSGLGLELLCGVPPAPGIPVLPALHQGEGRLPPPPPVCPHGNSGVCDCPGRSGLGGGGGPGTQASPCLPAGNHVGNTVHSHTPTEHLRPSALHPTWSSPHPARGGADGPHHLT